MNCSYVSLGSRESSRIASMTSSTYRPRLPAA
jgi:hypothetical protein